MRRVRKQSLTLILGVMAILPILSSPAMGQVGTVPPAGPLSDIQIQLNNIEVDIGNLQDTVDEIAPNLPKPQGPCEIPPVWGKKWPADERFVEVLDGGAYCDRETGLVWEGAPDITGGPNSNGLRDWDLALYHCKTRRVDDRRGWHLPLVEQLMTLVEPPLPGEIDCRGPCLPDGHPFKNVQRSHYWTATTRKTRPPLGPQKDVVEFNIGLVTSEPRDTLLYTWCVRGGQTFDGEDVAEVLEALP